ncbi:MAG: hypothetical protein QM493_03515 [Sulfurovum sp.]
MKKIIASILIVTSAYAGGSKNIIEPVCVVIDVPQQELYYNMALKVGTLGVGVDFSIPITNYLNARLNVNGFKYDYDTTQNGVDYSASATLLTAGVLLDYYPMTSNAFRVSAGVYYNGNKAELNAKATAPITLGSNTYTVGQIGSLFTETKLNEVAPYIGIGWGNKGVEKGWGFSVDIGAMYHGEPGIDTTVTTTLVAPASTTLKNDVEIERKKLEDDFKSYSFYPVVMLGVTYTF